MGKKYKMDSDWWIVYGVVLFLLFFWFSMNIFINGASNEYKWYIKKLHYNFCCEIQRREKLDIRGDVYDLYCSVENPDTINSSIEAPLQDGLEHLHNLRLIISKDKSSNTLVIRLSGASSLKPGGTICINSDIDSIYYSNGKSDYSFELSRSIYGEANLF